MTWCDVFNLYRTPWGGGRHNCVLYGAVPTTTRYSQRLDLPDVLHYTGGKVVLLSYQSTGVPQVCASTRDQPKWFSSYRLAFKCIDRFCLTKPGRKVFGVPSTLARGLRLNLPPRLTVSEVVFDGPVSGILLFFSGLLYGPDQTCFWDAYSFLLPSQFMTLNPTMGKSTKWKRSYDVSILKKIFVCWEWCCEINSNIKTRMGNENK